MQGVCLACPLLLSSPPPRTQPQCHHGSQAGIQPPATAVYVCICAYVAYYSHLLAYICVSISLYLLQVIIPMDAPRILMLEVAEQVAAVTLVSHLPGIQAVSAAWHCGDAAEAAVLNPFSRRQPAVAVFCKPPGVLHTCFACGLCCVVISDTRPLPSSLCLTSPCRCTCWTLSAPVSRSGCRPRASTLLAFGSSSCCWTSTSECCCLTW